jgi:localization factor PodJL
VRYKRRSHRDNDDDDESIGDDLAAINDRLDELTRHLERVTSGKRSPARDEHEQSPDRVAEALARLDRRLDQVIAEARSAPLEAQRIARQAAPPPTPPTPPPPPPPTAPPTPSGPNWAAEISARQRALDGGGRAGAMRAPAWSAPAPSQDLSALEHQLRQITTQIASLHQPYEDALAALRSDLAEVGRALKDAMPRQAVETLEAEVRTLSERIGRSRQAGGDPAALTGLEQGLAEVRDALRNLAPAENLIGFEDAVRGLSHKIDQLGSGATGPEPAVFHQLEEAIAAMRHVGSHVASDGALAQLAAEVHGLATRFEHATANSGNESLARLESRISALMESGRSLPPDLEASIHSLSERLDRMQLSQGDKLALGSLEDRIVKLVERLDASDARLGNLDAIERGMADVLIHLEEIRKSNARGSRSAVAVVEAAPPPEPPVAPIPPAPQLHAPAVLTMPAAAPADIVEQPPPVAASPPPPPPRLAPPRPLERRPIDPHLPPDTPLEPGSGVPRSKPGSPAARIAASEAALGGARPAIAEIGGKAAAIAAARNAAMAYQPEPGAKPARSWFSWFKTRKPRIPKPPKPAKAQQLPELLDPNAPKPSVRQRIMKQLKTLLIAISVVIIILGTLQAAMDYFMAPSQPETQPAPVEDRAPAAPSAPATAPATTPGRPMPTPDGTPPAAPSPEPGTTGSVGHPSSMFDPTTVLNKQRPANLDITGSIPRQTPTPRQTPVSAGDPALGTLPAAFGPALRAGAASGDHGAEYEIALRHAEGRGVPRNMDEAVRWLERGAAAGFAPAQFRLAGIHEKGEGVKKDIAAARRLYLAAAERGHAKAMHNLAVLYAEGADGKPDYRVAAQWFRRAAAYGVSDSQFNLAILHARGIGIEQNLAESYKWFALVAGTGDQDAAKKRDEVAGRLDQQTLMAAKLAAQTFTPQREAEEATSLKIPPGGWDRASVAVQPAKPKPRPRAPATP